VVAEAADELGVHPTRLGPLGSGSAGADRRRLQEALAEGEAGPVVARRAAGRDGGVADLPDRLGAVHQVLVADGERRARGVHYTPGRAADEIVALALARWFESDAAVLPEVCDPSCGGGAFLLAAARALVGRGHPVEAVVPRLHGIEVDPLAALVAVAAVGAWVATVRPGGAEVGLPDVCTGDALGDDPWARLGRRPDVVVGNPPFGGQLTRRTARRGDEVVDAGRRLGRPAGYADTAALFLARALDEVATPGVVALLQPLSLLATRDAGVVRDRVGVGRLRDLWVPSGRLFDAAVAVCAPIVTTTDRPPGAHDGPDASGAVAVVGDGRRSLAVPRHRLAGRSTWSPLWAAVAGVPEVDLDPAVTVGDWCRATAGFRDEFYAVAALVAEDPAPDLIGPPSPGRSRVLTAGLVDPGATGWGRRPARLGGRRFAAPVLDVAAAAASPERRLAAVVAARCAPKVVVATQTRVVEAVVDDDGRYWPSVPLVSITLRIGRDDAHHRWSVAAALMAPPVTAWVLHEVGGAARSPGAVKVSARQVLTVPLPVDHGAWREGTNLLRRAEPSPPARRAALVEAAGALTAAYGVTGRDAAQLIDWWGSRLVGRGGTADGGR
jgi:hypothetical protein